MTPEELGRRYVIKEAGQEPKVVTLDEWMEYESRAGFAHLSRNYPATEGFFYAKRWGLSVYGVIANVWENIETVMERMNKLDPVAEGEEG